MNRKKFPSVGDHAPAFEAQTTQGTIRFPEYSAGQWCIIFAHPANFSSAWEMFSTFVAMKERWLSERNIKVIGIANVTVEQNDWAQKASRFVGIYLRGPVVEDLDCSIAKRYGIASARRPLPDCNRLALVIDPQGIIRLIIQRPLMPSIESALSNIEIEPPSRPCQGPTTRVGNSGNNRALRSPGWPSLSHETGLFLAQKNIAELILDFRF